MVGRPKWLGTGGHGSPGDTQERIIRTSPVGTVARPVPDTYRVVRQRDGSFHVLEHRNGRVEVYGRLVGVKALERAEGIAEEMNRKEQS